MLFSRAGYEDLAEQFRKKYTADCRSEWDRRIMVVETSISLMDMQCRVIEVTMAVIFARLYANDYAALRRNMAKVKLLEGCGVIDRAEVLRVVWWCLADFLEHDASIILDEVERLIECNE